MKLRLEREHLNILTLGLADRSPTASEQTEIGRIVNYWSKIANDPNINDYSLKTPLSERDVFLLLSSACPKVMELTFQILSLQRDFSVNPESETSLLLGVIWHRPELFRVLLQEKHWNLRSDVSETLAKIRFKVHYFKRPKKTSRHRGYRDHGTLPDRQRILRSQCLSEYYAEELQRQMRYERELRDTIDLLGGLIE